MGWQNKRTMADIFGVRKAVQMRRTTLFLALVLGWNSVACPQTLPTQQASQSSKVKAEVQKRGISEKSRVKVRLRTKAEVKGYISKIEDASFEVTDKNTRLSRQ